jgi:hypothetical protein
MRKQTIGAMLGLVAVQMQGKWGYIDQLFLQFLYHLSDREIEEQWIFVFQVEIWARGFNIRRGDKVRL